MRLARRISLIVTVTLAMIVAAACGGGSGATSGGSGPVYKVATEAAYPPFEAIDEETGQFIGFDIELMEAIAEAGGFQVEWHNLAWDSLYPALHTNQVDLIISAMTITDERALQVQFSDPYFTAGQVIMVRADNTSINSPQDLVGKKVGVQANTTGQVAMEKIEGVRDEDIVKYETTADSFNALINGNVEAAVNDLPVVQEFIKNNPGANLRQVGSAFTVEYYGIAMRHGEPETLKLINESLAQVKASGKYDEIYKKYFGE